MITSAQKFWRQPTRRNRTKNTQQVGNSLKGKAPVLFLATASSMHAAPELWRTHNHVPTLHPHRISTLHLINFSPPHKSFSISIHRYCCTVKKMMIQTQCQLRATTFTAKNWWSRYFMMAAAVVLSQAHGIPLCLESKGRLSLLHAKPLTTTTSPSAEEGTRAFLPAYNLNMSSSAIVISGLGRLMLSAAMFLLGMTTRLEWVCRHSQNSQVHFPLVMLFGCVQMPSRGLEQKHKVSVKTKQLSPVEHTFVLICLGLHICLFVQ